MSVQALTNEYVTLNASNLSDHVKSATLVVDVNALDSSAMGDAWSDNVGGMKSGTLNIELLDDYAVSSIDSVMWALLGTVVAFAVRPDAGAISTSNPEYQGSVLVNSHSVGGSLGELPMKSYSLPVTGAVVRDVTP